jgi:hypothetical protein
VIATPELELVPLEPVVVLPEFEFVSPVPAPLDPAFAPPVLEPVPPPELPFVAPPFNEAPGEGSLEPLEQPPAAATAIIAAPASDGGRARKTTEREKRLLDFAKFTHKPYCVQARCHLSTPLPSPMRATFGVGATTGS